MDALLLVFAFTAGAAAFFAPCCVGLLPAYASYAIRGSEGSMQPTSPPFRRRMLMGLSAAPFAFGAAAMVARGLAGLELVPRSAYAYLPTLDAALALLLAGAGLLVAAFLVVGRRRHVWRGAAFGSLATAGIFAVFLTLGVPVALLAQHVAPHVPWLSLLVGILLALAGALMLAGRSVSTALPSALRADVTSSRGFFMFGIGYGVGGLGCTLPLFLGVVGAAISTGTRLDVLLVLGAYAAGKATVMATFTAVIVAGALDFAGQLRVWTPRVHRASGVLLLLGGAYLAHFYGRYALIGGA